MNGEIFTVLDSIERDKGIKPEVLIDAIESAIVLAVKKSLPYEEREISVKIDRKTGNCQLFIGDEVIYLKDFGRIAVQTVRQVVLQKLREAEKDVIFEDYRDRVGKIITGSVHQIEKGNIIVDVENIQAFLPKGEQLLKDGYRQGDVIRAFVVEVRKTFKLAPIVLSRTHPGMLVKLFELEVPEVYEGIVQIKGCVRDPGDRAKIAVLSLDPRVDCVGACVGKRGVRVKNIVKELRSERIDIIRYSDDPKEFVSAALAPAKVSYIMLDPNENRMDVVVPDDQLSLAIGKRGQNVRLASRLTGWDIDIYSQSEFDTKNNIPLASIDGVNEDIMQAFKKISITNLSELANTSLLMLEEIPQIGRENAKKILENARKIMSETVKKAEEQTDPKETGQVEKQ